MGNIKSSLTCRQCESLMSGALYNDLPPQENEMFAAHIAQCADCAATHQSLKATLAIMDQRERPQPSEHFWKNYWKGIEKRMPKEENALPRAPEIEIHSPAFRWARRALAAAAILLLGMMIGKYWFTEAPENRRALAKNNRPEIERAALDKRAQKYFEKSKVVLVGLVNTEPEGETGADFSAYRRVSQTLIDEASYLKPALAQTHQQRLLTLVEELELILTQIANLEAENDVSAIEIARSGVDRKSLLFKINLEEMRKVSETEAPAVGKNQTIL